MPKTSMMHFRATDDTKTLVWRRAQTLNQKPATVLRDWVSLMGALERSGALDSLDVISLKTGRDPSEVISDGLNARAKQLLDKE